MNLRGCLLDTGSRVRLERRECILVRRMIGDSIVMVLCERAFINIRSSACFLSINNSAWVERRANRISPEIQKAGVDKFRI